MKIIQNVKNSIRPFIPQILLNIWSKEISKRQFKKWRKSSCPVPPPHIVKEFIIKEYQEKYGYNILVETGTFMGDMVEAQRKRFKKIVSIELDVNLAMKAQKRFSKNKNIKIIQGDSGKVLLEILKDINAPAIFWLDGHYSEGITARGIKECPILEELEAILYNNKLKHILLIDDARYFVGIGDYPTIDKLKEFIKDKNEKYQIEVEHDIIRCVTSD